jgi:hypothetical protein
MNNAALISLIRSLCHKGATFASFVYTSKEANETSRYNVTLGFSYKALVEKSKAQLRDMLPTLSGLDLEAGKAIFDSLSATLDGTQMGYTKAHVYAHIEGIPGLKVNTRDDSLQLFGLVNSRTVLIPGIHKKVNSAPLTLAKKAIDKRLARSKFREFALDAGAIHEVRLHGKVLSFESVAHPVTPEAMREDFRKAKDTFRELDFPFDERHPFDLEA